MSRRRTSKYLQLEAESGSEDYESEEISEDLDNIVPIPNVPKAKSFSQFTQELEEKYKVNLPSEEDEEIDYEEVLEAPAQSSLLPNYRSPLLFLIRCKVGKEKDIVLKLYENIKDQEICSIVYKEGLKGYIYIESYKKQDVEDLLNTVRNVSRRRFSVVPFKEMIEAVSYKKSIIVGEFARIKSGKYKGDLVQILENYEDVVKIKAIPRIDNNKKLFDPNEHRNEVVAQDGGFYFNRDFYKDGFLIKIMLKNNLDFEVEPTFSELQELKLRTWFNINDPVRISKGDLKNLKGTIESVNGNVAIISSNNKRYEVSIDEIEKSYDPGQEVSYKGENGIVLKVTDKIVILGMDNFTREVQCLINEIKPPVFEKKMTSIAPQKIKVRRDPLLNKHVYIIAGEYKGLGGTVKDVFQEKCIIQLQSNHRRVTILRQFIREERPEKETTEEAQDEFLGGKTPSFKTPAFKTPSYRTPSFKTPVTGSNFRHRNTYAYEETGFDWLVSAYDGAEIISNGQAYVLSDIVDGAFKSKTGEVFFPHEVQYSRPEIYDRVVVLEGPSKGKQGTLISISEKEGKIRDRDEKIFMVEMNTITKKVE